MAQTEALPAPESMPPEHMRLIDPRTDQLETPLDDRGLVNIDQLIKDVKATVRREFSWDSKPNEHHFYWRKADYPVDEDGQPTALKVFRQLPINRGLIPINFHTWLHEVTIPPPVPEPEVVSLQIESWQVAHSVYYGARKAICQKRAIDRRSQTDPYASLTTEAVDADHLAEALADNFAMLQRNLDDLERIPPDFRLIEPSDDVHSIATGLGRFVGHQNMTFTSAVLRQV